MNKKTKTKSPTHVIITYKYTHVRTNFSFHLTMNRFEIYLHKYVRISKVT